MAVTSAVLAEAAVLSWAAWWLLYLMLLAVTRPRLPQAPDDQNAWRAWPPATAALLYPPRGRLPRAAASATLLDLAARGMFGYRTDERGVRWIRVAGPADPELRPFERQVYDHVQDRARLGAGVAPEAVLRLESDVHARGWYSWFTGQVLDDARQHGLIRPRAPWPLRALLRLLLLVPAGLACWAAELLPGSHLGAYAWFFVLVGFSAATLPVRRLRRAVPAGPGRAVAATYRRLRAELADPSPPIVRSARTDQAEAYALALGVTRVRDRELPLEPATDKLVWSSRGGDWCQIRVVESDFLFSGSEPRGVLWALPGSLAFLGIWAFLLGYGALHPSLLPVRSGLGVPVLAAGWLLWGFGARGVARFGYRGLYDQTHPAEIVTGQVVRLVAHVSEDETPSRYQAAVDQGTGNQAHTYEIGARTLAELRYGDWLRLEVTPKLRHVKRAEVLPRGGGQRLPTRPATSTSDSSAWAAEASNGGWKK